MKITITNVFGFYNRGDAVLVEQVVNYIRDAYGDEVEIFGIVNMPDYESKHLPMVTWFERIGKIEGRTLKKIIYHFRILLFIILRYVNCTFGLGITKSQQEGIKAISDSDLVISCAGGFLEDSNLSYLSNLIQLFVAVLYGRKIIIAPQSIGPIRSKFGRWVLKRIFKRIETICVREHISYDFVKNELDIHQEKLLKTTDLAFYYHYKPKEVRPILQSLGILNSEPFITCSVINWSFRNSVQPARDKENYLKSYSRLLRSLHQEFQFKIFVVNQVTSDLVATKNIERELGDYFIVDEEERTPEILINIIKQSEYFIGSRFHSTIFGLLSTTPLVSFSYLPKTDGMMEDLGLQDRVFDIYDFDEEKMLERISEDLRNPDLIKKQFRQKLENLRMKNIEFDKILRENK